MPAPRTDPRRAGPERDRAGAQPPQRVEATRRATALAAAPVLLLVLLLAGQLGLLVEQRRLIGEQRELQAVLTARSLPVLDAARPLLEDLQADRREVRAAARRADRLVRELRAADVPAAAAATRALAGTALTDDRLPRALDAVDGLAGAALGEDRLARALDATLDALAQERRLDLARDADRAAELAPTLVELQRQALEIQRTTLAVQQEALARIRSIDQKTGGPAPAVPTGR